MEYSVRKGLSMKNKVRQIFSAENLWYFLLLNLGLIITAAGTHLFKTPNHFAMGGTSGISIIGATLFPQMNVGDFMLVVNIILIVLGLIFLGRKAMGITIYSSIALSSAPFIIGNLDGTMAIPPDKEKAGL